MNVDVYVNMCITKCEELGKEKLHFTCVGVVATHDHTDGAESGTGVSLAASITLAAASGVAICTYTRMLYIYI